MQACPGKNGEKALIKGTYNDRLDKVSDRLFKDQINDTKFNKFTVKGVSYQKPYFEFSGACAGCGEAGYIKILTLLYGRNIVISNATGCSSIYGGSLPLTPYKIPWMNSLFEDNAEFAFGIHESYKNTRNRIKDIMYETRNEVSPLVKDIYKTWIDNMEDDDITNAVKYELENKDIPSSLRELIDYIPSRKVWVIGGDGWAYDIGYGGVDHVLSSNQNAKILVLDTEVYSNTGGQASKSSHKGAVAEFANNGKITTKKDLFRIAMSYPNTYVAQISLGANIMHTINVLKEAEEHQGPAIVIAYCPCVEHGINGGMSNSIAEEKLAVDSGYVLLMRYKDNKLLLDSKEPDFQKYDEFLSNEVRYKALKIKNKKMAESLLLENKENAINRYNYYKKLSEEN